MRILLIALMLFVSGISIKGQTINEKKAKSNVMEFITSRNNSNNVKGKSSILTLELAYTAQGSDKNADYYVFNNTDGGFIIAGGDEVAEKILAYSDEGSFDISAVPENFKYWLKNCSRQISYAKENKNKVRARMYDKSSRHDVDILVKTKWGQESPYNLKCPKVGNKSCVTGCVATAMAQVMKYHEWPEKGAGSHAYYDSYSKQNLSADFSSHTYDWTNMPNKFSNFSKTAQKEAVALLMSDCGISVEMQYDYSSGSGAWTENVTYALVNYFGYDKGAIQVLQDYTTSEEWDSIIYNELANKRPIIFSGGDEEGNSGHCFICDGYNSTTDKYHFNWGWDGSYDCYCAISAVKLDDDYDFRYMQDIIIGIQTPKEDTKAPVNIMAYDGELNLTTKQTGGYNTYTATYAYTEHGKTTYNQIYNHSYRDFDVIFAMKYTNTQTGKYFVTGAKNIETNKYAFTSMYPLDDDYTLHGITKVVVKDAILPEMPAGRYNISLVAKDYLDKDSDDINLWHEVKTYSTNKNYVTEDYIPTAIEETSIINVNADVNYNLLGIRVDKDYKGIVIQSGRKYLRR